MPRGLAHLADTAVAPFLKLTSFVVHRPFTREQCLSPELAKLAADFAIAAKPLFQFVWEVEGALTKKKLDYSLAD